MANISVVIPTYNRAHLLGHALKSVMEQTHAPLEVIVVDDGSVDGTEQVAASTPGPIRFIRQENSGAGAARNRGMREARGEFVAFLDSDDKWVPSKLATQLAVHRALPEIGWTLTDCTVVGPDGEAKSGAQGFARAFPVFRDLEFTPDQFFSSSLELRTLPIGHGQQRVYVGDAYELLFYGNFGSPCGFMAKRELLERVGGMDESFRVAQDTEYFHRVAAASPVGIIMAPLFHWRVGHGHSNTSPLNTITLIENALESIDRALRLRGPAPPSVVAAYLAGRQKLLVRLAYARLSVLDRVGALAAVREARRIGAPEKGRLATIHALALLPPTALSALRSLKSRVKAKLLTREGLQRLV
jgi:GT2 family glycosyltransferase